MGNTYPVINNINDYIYNDVIDYNDLNNTYRKINISTSETDRNYNYRFNNSYYSNELIDSLLKDISNNTLISDNPTIDGNLISKNNFNYKNCNSENDCDDNIINYNNIPNKDNLKKDPNLNLDKYSELKYLEEEIYNTESLVTKYYILLYVWFIIMLIILFSFFITVLSNNNEVNPIVNYIVTIFLLYCIYQIYKNIYNKL